MKLTFVKVIQYMIKHLYWLKSVRNTPFSPCAWLAPLKCILVVIQLQLPGKPDAVVCTGSQLGPSGDV